MSGPVRDVQNPGRTHDMKVQKGGPQSIFRHREGDYVKTCAQQRIARSEVGSAELPVLGVMGVRAHAYSMAFNLDQRGREEAMLQ